jgi:hypothetical protein
VISICGDPRLAKLAAIVRSNLARIGMSISVIESQQCPGHYQRADLLFTMFGANELELDPAQFVDHALEGSVYGSPLGPGPWRAPEFRREVGRAHALRGDARLVAFRHIERRLMGMAPMAVFGGYVWGEYISPKTGCRVSQAEFGFMDLGELCKKP